MNTIDSIIYNVDLPELIGKDTTLTYQNGVYRGECPIHGGKNNSSFCVWDTHYYCHACGATGNAINYIQEKMGLQFYQAVEWLCEKYGISTDNKEYLAQRSYFKETACLTAKFHKQVDKAIDYLTIKRGFTKEIIDEFRLGFDEGGFLKMDSAGIVIPIEDTYGRVVGFGKRAIDNSTPKYKNTYDDDNFHKRELLFNYHRAVKMIKSIGMLHVVEGYMDVISAHQQGIPCVGYMGGCLTKEQIGLLKGLQQLHKDIVFILAVDNDDTGRRMILKTRDNILKYAPDLNVRCVIYPKEEIA